MIRLLEIYSVLVEFWSEVKRSSSCYTMSTQRHGHLKQNWNRKWFEEKHSSWHVITEIDWTDFGGIWLLFLDLSFSNLSMFLNSETKKLFDSLAIRVWNKRKIRASERQFILTGVSGVCKCAQNRTNCLIGLVPRCDHVTILKILNLCVHLSGFENWHSQTLSEREIERTVGQFEFFSLLIWKKIAMHVLVVCWQDGEIVNRERAKRVLSLDYSLPS